MEVKKLLPAKVLVLQTLLRKRCGLKTSVGITMLAFGYYENLKVDRMASMKRAAKWTVVAALIVATAIIAAVAPFVLRNAIRLLNSFISNMDVTKASSLCVALCALFVALTNFRRGNTSVVRIVDLSASGQQSLGINNQNHFYKLEFRLQNLGIPLRNPSVSLNGIAGGWLNLPLTRFKGDVPLSNEGTFEKGMQTTYGFQSFRLDKTARRMLKSLFEPDAHDICLSLWADGFLVKRFYFPERRYLNKVRDLWNLLAWKLSDFFTTVKTYKGRPMHYRPTILPSWKNHRRQLEDFASWSASEPDAEEQTPDRMPFFGGQ